MTKIQMTKTVNPGRQLAFVWDFELLYLGFVSNFKCHDFGFSSWGGKTMCVLKMKPGAKARRDGEPVHHDSMDSSPHMRGISPQSGGPLSSFYSAGPALSLKGSIQAKLTIGQPNDMYEREADRVADQVMSMPEPKGSLVNGQWSSGKREKESSLVQRKAGCPECEEEKEQIQTKPLAEQITPLIQRQSEIPNEDEEEEKSISRKTSGSCGGSTDISSCVDSHISALKGKGQPLSPSTMDYFEPRFGSDFSNVRVHAGSDVAAIATEINAKAFTTGSDIFFNTGHYSPGTSIGNNLLAHELAHVVQQGKVQNGHIKTNNIQRMVRDDNVSCNITPRNYPIFKIMNTNNPVMTIRTADTLAIKFLNNTIGELELSQERIKKGEPAAFPTVSDVVAQFLTNKFGIDPAVKEVWNSTERSTSTGMATITLLLKRLQSIHDILKGGQIKYTCISPGCNADYWALSERGSFRIGLCKNFWKTTDTDRATTLIHEAFHVIYGATDSGQNMWNAHCIEQFIANMNNATIPSGLNLSCSKK